MNNGATSTANSICVSTTEMSTTKEQYKEAMTSLRDYGERTGEDLLNTVGIACGTVVEGIDAHVEMLEAGRGQAPLPFDQHFCSSQSVDFAESFCCSANGSVGSI